MHEFISPYDEFVSPGWDIKGKRGGNFPELWKKMTVGLAELVTWGNWRGKMTKMVI